MSLYQIALVKDTTALEMHQGVPDHVVVSSTTFPYQVSLKGEL